MRKKGEKLYTFQVSTKEWGEKIIDIYSTSFSKALGKVMKHSDYRAMKDFWVTDFEEA